MAEEIIESSIAETGPLVSSEKETSKDAPSTERIEFHETGHERAEAKYKQILSKVVSPKPASASDDDAVIDAKSLGDMTDEEGKVQRLVDLAQTKGVEHAVKVARSLGDYYVLDRMHDELAGKFYDGLVEKGLIEKE